MRASRHFLRALTGLWLAALLPVAVAGEPRTERVLRTAINRAEMRLRGQSELWQELLIGEGPWESITPHYRIVNHRNPIFGKLLGDMLEVQHAALCEFFGITSSRVHHVLVLRDLESYNQFGGTHGAEHSSAYGGFFAGDHPDRPAVSYYRPEWTYLWTAHAAVHQWIETEFRPGAPTWVEEGLASYFPLSLHFFEFAAFRLESMVDGGGFEDLTRFFDMPLVNYTGSENRWVELGMFFRFLLHDSDLTLPVAGGGEIGIGEAFQGFLRECVAEGRRAETLPFYRQLRGRLADVQEDFRTFPFTAGIETR